MTQGPPELKILRVELTKESLKTYRVTHGDDSQGFQLLVWFTRALTPFERVEITKQGLDLVLHEFDPMRAFYQVDPEHLSRQIDTLNTELRDVAIAAEEAHDVALVEDERIRVLVEQINDNISPMRQGGRQT